MKSGLLVLIVLLVAGVGLGGWYLYYGPDKTLQSDPSPFPEASLNSPAPSPSSTDSEPVDRLPTKYITAVDWPPKTNVTDQPFSCTEAGSETDRAGQTKKQIINDHTYCITKETEGAAGSIYTQYAYAFAEGDQTKILTFSLKFVQCGNYPDPEKTACETERQTFNIDNFMDQYIQNTIK